MCVRKGGTCTEAAVQTNSTHSEGENKAARFEGNVILQQRRTARKIFFMRLSYRKDTQHECGVRFGHDRSEPSYISNNSEEFVTLHLSFKAQVQRQSHIYTDRGS